MTYLAWLKEPQGWTAFEIEADSHDDAMEIAGERFQGTPFAYTLDVELHPIERPS